MSAGIYFFLQTLWLQQIVGVTGFVVSLYAVPRVQRVWLRVWLLFGASMWLCVAVRGFILWGIWIGGKT